MSDTVTLLLTGDVMLGRGLDQILAHPGDPTLHESYLRDARDYADTRVLVRLQQDERTCVIGRRRTDRDDDTAGRPAALVERRCESVMVCDGDRHGGRRFTDVMRMIRKQACRLRGRRGLR